MQLVTGQFANDLNKRRGSVAATIGASEKHVKRSADEEK
jgi:hypothetical protein